MKIGLFMPTVNNGFIMSEAAPQYRPDFDYNKEVVQKAERYGMDFALSLVKYRGFGGKTDHWHWALDSFTTIAGLAAVTDRIKLIGSVGLQAHHPAVAARHAAMIQQISHGRFWLNIVTGWQKSEYESLGLWRGDEHYASRYDYADEYITICRELWETGESSFKGRYFELDGAQLEPRPQEPIKVVCAASSDRGRRFTAENGDYNFIFGTSVDALRETNQQILEAAGKAGREIKSIAVDPLHHGRHRRGGRRAGSELLRRGRPRGSGPHERPGRVRRGRHDLADHPEPAHRHVHGCGGADRDAGDDRREARRLRGRRGPRGTHGLPRRPPT